jgi:glucose/arabinose dehydrogenase
MKILSYSLLLRTTLFFIATVIYAYLVAILAPQAHAAPPAGFQSSTVILNLQEPTTLVFTPDNRMFIAERGGRIRVVQPNATAYDSSPLLQLTNIDTEGGERGLVGLALDPNFAANNYYYVFYTSANPLRNRVSRFTAAGNTTMPGSEVILWEDPVTAADYHHAGTVAFGPDGRIYISVGDGFDGL